MTESLRTVAQDQAFVDRILAANAERSSDHAPLPKYPAEHLAVVTCMDTRLDVENVLGLQTGQAHILRNAGGLVTPDVLRSLSISQRALGTRAVLVMQHTGCGMFGFDDDDFRVQLFRSTGQVPTWDVPGFDDLEQSVRRACDAVSGCAWLPHRDVVRGVVVDIDTGRLSAV